MKEKDNYIVEKSYEGYVFKDKIVKDNEIIFHLSNETGYGEMKCIKIINGIELSFNKLYMETAYQKIYPKPGILVLDYCIDGCYEYTLKNNYRSFIGKGDLNIIELGKNDVVNSSMPLKKYIGITLFINIKIAQKTIDDFFPYININLQEISNRLCKDGCAMIIHSREKLEHIISELLSPEERLKNSYLIIKTIELLLFLSIVDVKDTSKVPSFSEPIYTATKNCYDFIINNPFERQSIYELSKKYGVSESSLKRCFYYISGSSIGTFIKNNRLDASAKLLRSNPNISISEVSHLSGYINQSKYSSAFKKRYNKTPKEYRYEND